jgi:hypothetical protein
MNMIQQLFQIFAQRRKIRSEIEQHIDFLRHKHDTLLETRGSLRALRVARPAGIPRISRLEQKWHSRMQNARTLFDVDRATHNLWRQLARENIRKVDPVG